MFCCVLNFLLRQRIPLLKDNYNQSTHFLYAASNVDSLHLEYFSACISFDS
jgi:hypothetical protein